jgi:hypothetical protein
LYRMVLMHNYAQSIAQGKLLKLYHWLQK